MTAYYNEIDPFNVAWLRELIKAGIIAPGDVDERSIEDVRPEDLEGYTQCHFFAGVGVWSYALRIAGWDDDRICWTGSCPCQPFSAAGKRGGFDDKRHLWPHFEWLIAQQKPDTIFGEQVASKDGLAWFDVVQADLEGTGYAVGAVDTCAAGFGAPHIRQRLYWVADAKIAARMRAERCGEQRINTRGGSEVSSVADLQNSGRIERKLGDETTTQQAAFRNELGVKSNDGGGRNDAAHGRPICELADNKRTNGRGEYRKCVGEQASEIEREIRERAQRVRVNTSDGGSACVLADVRDEGSQGRIERRDGTGERLVGSSSMELQDRSTGPTNGFWRDADWLFCRDEKWRPVESIAIEMDDGLADRLGYMRVGDRYSLNPLIEKGENRMMRLKGYGNAIVASQAQAFIEVAMECLP